MDDLKSRLQDVHERARPAPGAFERLADRRRRRLRRRQVGAVVLAFVLGVGAASLVFSAFRAGPPEPATVPSPTVGPPLPRATETLIAPFDPRIRMEVPTGWAITTGPATIVASSALAGGGTVEVFVWHLPSLRPLDPETGRAASVSADDREWFARFRARVVELGLFPDVNNVGSGSEWHWHPPVELLWLLLFEDAAGPYATDAGVAGQGGPALSFGRTTAATVFRTPDGEVELPAGSYWVWRPARPLPVVIGWASFEGADRAAASEAAWELLHGISLPRIPWE